MSSPLCGLGWLLVMVVCSGLAVGEAVGVGAGFDDVTAEGDAVDDGGAESGVGEGAGPAIWGWHLFVVGHPCSCLV